MNHREASILQPVEAGKARRVAARRWLTGITVCCVWIAAPPLAPAQTGDGGPAVIPPAAAYIGAPDGVSEASLPRWHVETAEPRTLWVYFASPPPGRPDFWDSTLRAMRTWNEVGGVPVSFRRTHHQSEADVEFGWIRRFESSQAGTTDWRTDGDGWLDRVVVTLALEHEDGTAMSAEFLSLVSLHELGHVIGLPHSEDPADVMHPGNRNLELSDRDILSARQLYRWPDPEKVVIP